MASRARVGGWYPFGAFILTSINIIDSGFAVIISTIKLTKLHGFLCLTALCSWNYIFAAI